MTLTDPDEYDDDDKCTLIVSLMQKPDLTMRTKRKTEFINEEINFDVYKVSARWKFSSVIVDG